MDTYKVRITFTEPILGTVPKDPEVYAGYIAGKARHSSTGLRTAWAWRSGAQQSTAKAQLNVVMRSKGIA